MQSSIITVFFVLASISVFFGNAFTAQPSLRNSRQTTSAIFGKRQRALKKVKRIFKGNDKPVEVEETKPKVTFQGEKVKLSNGRAKDLAKKYKNIDDLEEKTFQVLVDLNMVGRS